jgi:hypothetical protein
MTTFKKLAIQDDTHRYAIASDDTLYMHNGSSWSQKSTTGLLDIDVDKNGILYGIKLSDSTLIKWSGTTWGSSLGAQTLKSIAVKANNLVYGIGADDTTYYWNGAYWIQVSADTVSSLAISKI